MELDDYQRVANATDQRPGRDEQALVFPLMGLASEVGSLVNQYKKRVRDGDAHELFSHRVAEELGDVLWYVSNLATKLGLRLEEVALLNLRRTRQRWPSNGTAEPMLFLDDEFPPEEQLPRSLEVRFEEAMESGRPRVRMFCGGAMLGDPLSDMAWEDDAYRYHDAFHLTYAALLGWSPITRAMLGRQRSSDTRYREIEDSGRAKVVEEAISAVAFEYARSERYLVGVSHLDFSLLQTIAGMASGFEVRVRSVYEWEQAILESFRIWNQLRIQEGGLVSLDLYSRTIRVRPVE